MSRISPFPGGNAPPDVPARDWFSSVIFRALAEGDANVTSLAHELGVVEESLRNYRDGRSGPNTVRLYAMCRRMRAGMLLDVLQSLAGGRAIVWLVDNLDVPSGTRPADVVKEMIQALSGFDALLQDTYERAADGVISAEDAASIAKGWAQVRQLGERAVRYSQHCAHRAGGRR